MKPTFATRFLNKKLAYEQPSARYLKIGQTLELQGES